MGRNLFSVGGLYFEQGDSKGVTATWGISSDAPDRIQGMVLTGAILAVKAVIPLKDVAAIDTCDIKGKGNQTGVRLTLKGGSAHVMDLKKEKKAQETVSQLLPFWRAQRQGD